jgi:hypothetical protein
MVMGVEERCRRLKKRRAGYRDIWHQKGAKYPMKNKYKHLCMQFFEPEMIQALRINSVSKCFDF